jgi:hypothetical protein
MALHFVTTILLHNLPLTSTLAWDMWCYVMQYCSSYTALTSWTHLGGNFTGISGVDVDWVRRCLWTATTNGPIVHYSDSTWVWRMMSTGETEELEVKPVPVPLCTPQIPHLLTQARTWASAVRGRPLTAWAKARPTGTPTACYVHILRENILRANM